MDNTRNTNRASSKPHPLRYEHTYSITACIHSISSSWEGGLSGPLKRLAYSMQDRPFSAWETQNHAPDIFQHQSTGYLRTRGQETLYETCACVIHTNLQLHYYSTMRHSTIDLSLFSTSEESFRD